MDALLKPENLEKIGVIGLTVIVIIVGFKLFQLFMAQWENSTDAVNKNTAAFTELSKVFERANQREIEWQEKAMDVMKDTNKKVTKIHDKIV